MSEWITLGASVLISLVGGGGGVWALMQARTSKRLGVEQNHIEKESTTVTGFRQLVESLTAEVERLREDRDEDRAELQTLRTAQAEDRAYYTQGMDELRGKHDAVAQENRAFRAVILGVLDHLRRVPPPAHTEIVAYILDHFPWLGKDKT